jgi:tetrapyrrole methylase family protein/MazG family protein
VIHRRASGRIPVDEFSNFMRIVRRLRRECPWDRKQTHRSLRESLIEEAYEVVDAIDQEEPSALKEELGDLLLHVAMHATIAEETHEFSFCGILDAISAKLIRRHPHVFGERRAHGAADVARTWELLKMKEGRTSILDGIPARLPSLQRAYRVQRRASHAGFDWKKPAQVWSKLEEEMMELREATRKGSRKRREQEFGDFLFSVVNYARFLGVNPENALRSTVGRFEDRFRYIERSLARRKRSIHQSSLKEMDMLWEEAKNLGRKPIRRKKHRTKSVPS